jgi:hypothetical protein
MSLYGTYCGIVENVSDPLKLGRIKARVPHVYGAAAPNFIGTNDLPWAIPCGMAAGNSPNSGGFSHLPEPGDQVLIRFLDGEPEKPIWEAAMQTTAGAEALKLHQYEETNKKVGKPKRAGWTRYSHTIELNKEGIVATTSQGYRATLTDGDPGGEPNGVIQVATPKGNFLELDDDTGSWTGYVLEDFYLNIADTIQVQARALDFDITQSATVAIGSSLDLTTVEGISIVAGDDVDLTTPADINFAFARLKLGLLATEPFVLGNQLSAFLTSLLAYLTAHTHTNGNNGSPTGPPIIPPDGVVLPAVPALLSTVITGQ